MAGIQKNFKITNGLEVNENLIFADKDQNTVGIGTTVTVEKLQVSGGIGATSIVISGIATISTFKSTDALIDNGYISVGIVTTLSGTDSTYTTSNSTTLNATTGNIVTGVVTSVSGTDLTYTSGNLGTLNVNNLYAVSGLTTNGTITNLTGVAATITSGAGSVKIGIGTTALVVEGDARVTGILTVGTSSLTLNGETNQINGVTISSGIVTATTFSGDVSLANGSESAPSIKFSSSTTTGIYSPGTNQFAITTNGVGRITIDASGNIVAGGTLTAGSFIPTSSTVPTNGLYSPGTNQLALSTNGTERLRIDSTGQIEAVSLGTAAAPTFSWTGDPNTGIYSPGADQLAISTNGTGRLFVDASGRVGLGVAAPDHSFQLNGATATTLGVAIAPNGWNLRHRFSVPTVGNEAVISCNYNGSTVDDAVYATSSATFSPGLIRFATGGTNTAPTERMRLDSSGRLGLGTSSPNSRLNIVDSSADPAVLISNGSASAGTSSLGFRISTTPVSVYSAGVYAERTNSPNNGDTTLYFQNTKSGSLSTSLLIDTSGRVGIGTTSPATLLHLRTTGTPILRIQDDDGTGQYSDFYNSAGQSIYNAVNGAGVKGAHIFLQAGTEAARIDTSGRLGLGTSVPSAGLTVGLGSGSVPAAGSSGSSGPAALFGNSVGLQTYGLALGATTAGLGYIQAQRADGTATTYNLTIQPNGGNLGIGTTIARDRLHLYGAGQTTANIADSGTRGGFLRVSQSGSAAGTGGGILFASQQGDTANSVGFAAIKGLLTDGANNTAGELAFSVRNTTSATSLQEAFRVDTSGRLLVGTSTPIPSASNANGNAFCISGSHTLFRSSSDVNSQYIEFIKQRAGGTVVSNNDRLGQVIFEGHDGTNPIRAAEIQAAVDGTPGANDMPGRLTFSVTADGASSPTERMRIDSSGRVGIGTTSPGVLLSLQQATGAEYLRLTADNATTNGDQTVQIHAKKAGVATHNLQFDATSFIVSNTGAERARIDSSGRLLVGTSTARASTNFKDGGYTTPLQIEGAADNVSYGPTFVANTGTTNPTFRGAIATLARTRGTSLGSNTSVSSGDLLGTLQFSGADGTNLVPAASITAYVDTTPGTDDMPGRLVFSTTADGASSPTERMRITSGGSIITSSTGDNLNLSTTLAAGTTNFFLRGRHSGTAGSVGSGTNAIIIYTNGNVVNTNNSYGAISDIKLKENIVDANSQWSDIKALRPVNYNFKEGQTHTQLGLIAQEVELVSPGLVSESPDRDEDGNDLGTVTKSVNYSVLYMKAVKALQEAMERIEVLEAKVNALEGN